MTGRGYRVGRAETPPRDHLETCAADDREQAEALRCPEEGPHLPEVWRVDAARIRLPLRVSRRWGAQATMSKPRLLDLFCGAGGAARGYQRAGFYVVGVDINPQPRYCGDEFVQADALKVLEAFDCWTEWGIYDAIHASPPCQEYSALKARNPGKAWPDLVAATRKGLIAAGVPWVIENVMPAPLRSGVVLCGCMFGLRTYRARRFESSELMMQPEHRAHTRLTSTKKRRKCFEAGLNISVTGDVGRWVGPACMGIDWMDGNELSQAIPPAYTEWIGRELLQVLASVPAPRREPE